MKEYMVKFWHQDEDGREDFFECDTLEQAREFCIGLDGMVVIQKYNEERNVYECIVD